MSNRLEPDGLAGCFRCAYIWRARSADPERCPRCKSRLWDVPKLHAVKIGLGLASRDALGEHRQDVLDLLRANKARNPRVFGSFARAEGTLRSDLDLLVDFDSDASLFDQISLKQGLEQLLHRDVDVVDPRDLHWLARPQVLFEATPL